MRPDPEHQVDRKAIIVWRTVGGLRSLILWVAAFFYWLYAISGNLPFWIFYAILAIALVNSLLATLVIPKLKWKNWRYQINEHEIDLKRGILVKYRTLIPINRVQHVDTRQGPIMRDLKLATVTISTAASLHEIPCLEENIADTLRNEISGYASLAREDV